MNKKYILIMLVGLFLISFACATSISQTISFSGSNMSSASYSGRTHISYVGYDNATSTNYDGDIGFFVVNMTADYSSDETAPTITIINPTTTNNPQYVTFRINTDEIASCDYDLDGEGRIPLPTSNNLTFTTYRNLAGDTHSVIFYCTDASGNSGNSGLFVFELANVGTGGVITGGGSGSTIKEISIYNMSISAPKGMYSNSNNIVYIKVYDINGELTDADKIYVNLSVNPVKKEISRISEGIYRVDIELGLNITSISIIARAEQNGKIIEQKKDFYVSKPSYLQEKINKLKEEIIDFEGFLRSYYLHIIICLILFAIIIISIYLKKKYSHTIQSE